MPYLTPTASEFKTRYPEFDAVADATINLIIAEANRHVDESWFEADYQPAIMALAAHIAVSDGLLGGSSVGSGVVVSEKLGDASINYASPVYGASGFNEYYSTSYGRTYLRIARGNVPAVLIT